MRTNVNTRIGRLIRDGPLGAIIGRAWPGHGARAVHRANALFASRSSSLGATARRDERISRPRAARLVASGAASATELCAHAPLSGLLGPSPEPTTSFEASGLGP